MQNTSSVTFEGRLSLCSFEKQNPLLIPLGTESVILEGWDSQTRSLVTSHSTVTPAMDTFLCWTTEMPQLVNRMRLLQ